MYCRNPRIKNLKWLAGRAKPILNEIELFIQRNGGKIYRTAHEHYYDLTTHFGVLRLTFYPQRYPCSELTIFGRFEDHSQLGNARRAIRAVTWEEYLLPAEISGKWNFHYCWVPKCDNQKIIDDFRRAICSVLDPEKVHYRDAQFKASFEKRRFKVTEKLNLGFGIDFTGLELEYISEHPMIEQCLVLKQPEKDVNGKPCSGTVSIGTKYLKEVFRD